MDLLERDDLLKELHVQLAASSRREGRLALVAGEAGIGKSALLHRFRRTLPTGTSWLLGACDPLPTPRPLGPLLDMVPELPAEVVASLEDGRRNEVFRTLHGYLRSQTTPLVLVFEDLHWADEATLDLLHFLGRRLEGLPALLIATFRDDEVGSVHPLRLLLGDLATSAHTRRLRIPPLSAAAVAELAQGSPFEAAELHRVTRGNPFYLTEILAAGEGLPDSVRDAVLARVARLPDAARAYLDMAAVIGDRIDLQLLERTIDAPPEGLEAALLKRILQASGVTPPITLSFRHELARQALLDALSHTRRRELHARVLAALERQAESATPDLMTLLAHHAEGAGNGPAVLRYAPAAAARAAKLSAHREAAAQYARALRFTASLDPHARAELLERLAYERYLTVDIDGAVAARREALELRRRAGDRLEEGANLRWLSRLSWFRGLRGDAMRFAREALEVLEPEDPGIELAWAYSNRSQLAMLAQDTEDALRWGERALRLAREFGSVHVQVHALNNIGTALLYLEREEGRAHLEASLELAQKHGLEEHVVRAFTNLSSIALEQRQLERAERYLEAGIGYCVDHDLDSWYLYMLSKQAFAFLYRGRWAEATDTASKILTYRQLPAVSRIQTLVTLGTVRARRGDPEFWDVLDEAWALARETEELQRLGPVAAARAEAAWLDGRLQDETPTLRQVFDLATARRDAWSVGELGYWCWKAGDTTTAPPGTTRPYALQMAGRAREAAAAWQELGCPYEAARALSESDDPADLAEARAGFEALGARPMLERLGATPARITTVDETEPFVRLLGPPAVRYRGAWHQPPFGKTAALLYLLAYRADWVQRDELILLLWPDVSDKRARASLRNLLSQTARTLPFAAGLEVEPRRVRWQVDSDARAFADAARREYPSAPEFRGGALLAGFHPLELPEFEHWLQEERTGLHAAWRSALLARARAVARDDPGAAAAALTPLLDRDDLDEDVVRLELGYLHAAGRSLDALERYRRFSERLRDEIGGEPAEETAALARAIRRDPG